MGVDPKLLQCSKCDKPANTHTHLSPEQMQALRDLFPPKVSDGR